MSLKRGTNDESGRWYHVFFRLDRKAGIQPGAPTTDQCTHVGPSGVSKLARRTGARRFIHSSTVDDERGVVVETRRSSGANDIVGWNAHGASPLERIVAIGAIRADVDQNNRGMVRPEIA